MVVGHNVQEVVEEVAYCHRMVLDWAQMVDQVAHVVQVLDNGMVVGNVVQEEVVAHHSTDRRGLDDHRMVVHNHHCKTVRGVEARRSGQEVVVAEAVVCSLLSSVLEAVLFVAVVVVQFGYVVAVCVVVGVEVEAP